MTDPDPDRMSVWECAYQTADKLGRAVVRCRRVAEDEEVIGYEESAQAYLDLADEINAARPWVADIFTGKVKEVS